MLAEKVMKIQKYTILQVKKNKTKQNKNKEEFEDTNVVIRNRKSKDR